MTLPAIRIGLLFSRSGPYAELGRQGFEGAMAAIRAICRRGDLPFRFEPVIRDPEGNTDRYAVAAREIVAEGVEHIVGCTTSWSRKEVIPVMEKTGALLWYPCVYEGFEANENVVYIGAAANQQLAPLLAFAMPRAGRRGFLVGSNYIWGWETCRIAREMIVDAGGAVLGERHVPLADADIARIIEEIARKKPDFVVNALIGPSSYAFLAAYRALGDSDADFAPGRRPVLSCNLCENEVAHIAPAAEGSLTASAYFQALDTAPNREFLASLDPQTVAEGVSSFFAQAYAAVLLIAEGLAAGPEARAMAVLERVKSRATPSPLGPLTIDPANNHLHAPAHIARATAAGHYEILQQAEAPARPDPFMIRLPGETARGGSEPVNRPNLRIV